MNKFYYLTVKLDKKLSDTRVRVYAEVTGRKPAKNNYLAYINAGSLAAAIQYFKGKNYIIEDKNGYYLLTEKLLKMNNNNEFIY